MRTIVGTNAPTLPVYVDVDDADPTVLHLRENGALIGRPDWVEAVTTSLLSVTVGEEIRYEVMVVLECVQKPR